MKIGEELFLKDLEPGMAIGLTWLTAESPKPLCISGVISEIVARCVVVRLSPPRDKGPALLRLHANAEGKFVFDNDHPVRVVRGGKEAPPWEVGVKP